MKIGAGEKLEPHQFAAPSRAFYLPRLSLATDSLQRSFCEVAKEKRWRILRRPK
jgi:hypothetical protein